MNRREKDIQRDKQIYRGRESEREFHILRNEMLERQMGNVSSEETKMNIRHKE